MFAKQLISRRCNMCMMYCLLNLYLGHEFGNRLRQKGIAIVHSDRASGMLGFEVTGYLLQQLVKSVREAKEYRKELGL